MNRPKKEDFARKVFDGNFETMYVSDSEAYQEALNDYIDQLENAFNKACEMLANFDFATHCVEDEFFNKEEWKEWCIKDE